MERLNKVFDKLNFGARKNFIRNFFSLAVFQVIELLIPLITIPIIINKVGIENFGLINFALVFAIFFQLIINFGFNTISIREISLHQNDFIKITKIHNDTIFIKTSKPIINSEIDLIWDVLIENIIKKLHDIWYNFKQLKIRYK